jgi:kumamolisin
MDHDRLVPLPLSERHAPAGAVVSEDVDPNETLSVTLYVRRRPGQPELPEPDNPTSLTPTLSDEEFAAMYGADQADIDRVVQFAERAGLHVTESSPIKRSVSAEGSVEAMQRAFGVQLRHYREGVEEFRGRVGPVSVPEELSGIVDSVFGLDDRRVGRPRLRRSPHRPTAVTLPYARAVGLPTNTFLPPAVADLYRFPPGTDGDGQSVAILNFNEADSHGGYSADALRVFFEQVVGTPVPEMTDIVVHGQGNDPGTDDGSDPFDTSGEVMLDVQMVGGCAPKAKIIMYWTQFTEQGWVDAINSIITDTENQPSVISVSYGNPEDDPRSAWTASAIKKVNEAFRAAAARGITICCAAGDDGSRDQAGDGAAHADFPASSPYVLGCGGTQVIAPQGSILYESVWNNGPGSATGGGISRFFPVPSYQRFAGVPRSVNPDHHSGRGIPDVSGIADPETGVAIVTLDGEHLAVIGGTSATAPMWAALVARLNQGLQHRLGFLNPPLYRFLNYPVMRDITVGNNGAYQAVPGWDPCTGVGSPDGINLLAALRWLLQTMPPPHGDPNRAPRGAAAGDGTQSAPAPAGRSAADPDGELQPFVESYASYTTEVADAWQRLTTTGAEAGWDAAATTFRHEVGAAYLEYVGALKEAWRKIQPAKLNPVTLAMVGASMNSAGTVTSMALPDRGGS